MKLGDLLPEQLSSTPARILAFNQFISSVGLGAFLAGSALFYVRFIGLTPAQVGIGVSVAGVVGLLATVPAGRIADRFGPRELGIGLALAEACLVAAYAWTHSFLLFLVIICLLMLVEKSAGVVRNTLLVGLFGREGRIALKAYMRSLFNAGFAVGALLAAVPLQIDTPRAYLSLVFGYAATALLTSVLMWRLPRVTPTHQDAGKRRPWTAVRDVRFIAVAVACGVIAIHSSALHIALPLWIAGRTGVTMSVYSALLILNTVLVVLLQVRFARQATTVDGAVRLIRRAGFALLPACALFGLASTLPTWPAMAALVAGAVVLTVAELWMAAGIWTLSFELADPAAPGEYQGAFALGMSTEGVVGPVLTVACVTYLGAAGWWLLGAAFVGLGLLLPLLVRAAKAGRPHLTEPVTVAA